VAPSLWGMGTVLDRALATTRPLGFGNSDLGVALSPPAQPDSVEAGQPLLGLDRQGWIQAVGGVLIGLIALFSSYDHASLFSISIGLDQQWGIWLIAASMANVIVDAELATGSR